MNSNSDTSEIMVRPASDIQLMEFEHALLSLLSQHGLPSKAILVTIPERLAIFNNLTTILARLDDDQKQRSIYISKFVIASASGLFDAALNYLWDETIIELRRRVSVYDLSYFFDNAIKSEDKRKHLGSEEDLIKIDDSELILGAKEIGLLSDLGFRHLDYIRYLRNWVSAAHPNQNELTGLQLASALETCIREVITLPPSNAAIEIKKLLTNIKANTISDVEAREIGKFFIDLTQDQVNNLASGFFGIYTRDDTIPSTRANINKLLPLLWGRVDELTRSQFGIKYGKFVANNDQQEKMLARQFLEVVSATSYMPRDLRAVEIESAIADLLSAHRNMNNFYTEPTFARQLQTLVGGMGKVPPQMSRQYVLALVEVYLTNGNGVALRAEPIYLELLRQFDQEQAIIAILSFETTIVASRLQFYLCQMKYRELLDMMRSRVSAPAVFELLDAISSYSGPLDKLRDDIRVRRLVDSLQTILSH